VDRAGVRIRFRSACAGRRVLAPHLEAVYPLERLDDGFLYEVLWVSARSRAQRDSLPVDPGAEPNAGVASLYTIGRANKEVFRRFV